MVQPINYLANMPQVDIGESLLQGLQVGATFRQLQEQQEARQQAEQRLQAYRGELESAFSQGRPEAFERLMTLFPEHQAAVKPQYDRLSKVQQQNELSSVTNVRAAIETGNTQYAKQLIERQIQAAENSNADASMYKNLLEQIDIDPKMVASNIDYTLSTMLAPKEYKDWAEAISKVSETRRAEAMAPAELAAKKRQNVPTAIQEAIDYENLAPQQQKTFQALQVLKRPPAAVTNVNVTNLEKTASGELAKLLPDLYDQANSAVSQLTEIPRYRKALETAITGPFAEQRLSVAKVANSLGFVGDKSINATRELIQGNADMALRARSLLTGQGAVTDAEQRLLIQAKAGDINFTKGELQTLFNVFERAGNAQYQKSTSLLKSAAGKSETAQMFLDNVSQLPSDQQQQQKQSTKSAANTVTVGGKTYARPANFTDAQWSQYKQEMGFK